jgi:hypothetical protein
VENTVITSRSADHNSKASAKMTQTLYANMNKTKQNKQTKKIKHQLLKSFLSISYLTKPLCEL